MEVVSNKIKDIRTHYLIVLRSKFSAGEAKQLLMTLLVEFSAYSKNEILLYPDKTLSESELLKIHFGVKELLKNKPVQYITGYTDFLDVRLRVDENVLIPRPETEELVEIIRKEWGQAKSVSLRILDIGTGSGAIAIALKKFFPAAAVTGIDISPQAVELARRNAEYNGVKVDFRVSDMLNDGWKGLGSYDIIVSNPPYVREKEKKEMHANVLEYEPAQALFVPDDDALGYYVAIARNAPGILRENGTIYLEINQYLPDETAALFSSFAACEIRKDFKGNSRFLVVRF